MYAFSMKSEESLSFTRSNQFAAYLRKEMDVGPLIAQDVLGHWVAVWVSDDGGRKAPSRL